MRILDRYIARAILSGFGVVLFILLSLFTFLAFVRELDEVGRHNYRLADAALFVALSAPRFVLDLAPVAALLGGLLGLGSLGRGSELIAMLTSGVSLRRFMWSVSKPAIGLVVGSALITQFVAPPLQQLAHRSQPTPEHTYQVGGSAFWSRDDRRILHVSGLLSGQIPRGVELYELDANNRLRRYVYADRADPLGAQQWRFMNVREKTVSDRAVAQQTHDTMDWNSFLTEAQFDALQVPVNSLSPSSLYQYVRYLKKTHQTSSDVELILWQKVLLPFTVGAMALLAAPFGFALQRTNLTQRLMLGAGTGVVLYLTNQIVVGLVGSSNLSLPLVSALPFAIVSGLTTYLVWRIARGGIISR